jgi:hypothetical protein
VGYPKTPALKSLTVGDTFLNQNPGSPEHLWIVVAVTPTCDAVIFNVSTLRNDSDQSCVLKAGEHPFVKHDSAIAYNRGQLLPRQAFESLQRIGWTPHVKASVEVVKRVREGALKSRFTAAKLKTAITNNPIS